MRRWSLLLAISALAIAACAQTDAPDLDASARVDGGLDQGVPDQGHDGPVGDGGIGCDLAPVGDGGAATSLFLSATAKDGTAYAAARRGDVWSVVSTSGSSFSALVATQYQGRPMVVGRKLDDSLVASTIAACGDQLPAPTPIFSMAFTAERPAPVGGAVVDLVFRGSISGDQRLFATHYDGIWSAAKPLGNFLSILPPVAFRSGTQVHALFTGTDGKLYDGVVDDSGGAASQLPGATSGHGPAAVTSDGGVTYVVWTGDDTNLYFSSHVSGSAYAAPVSLCDGQSGCLIASNQAPVLSLDANGIPTAAWIGKDDGLVYLSAFDPGSGKWTAAVSVSTEPTALMPALAPGIADSMLEIAYVRSTDGQGRHVRKLGALFTTAVDLPGPKLGSQPSLLRLP